METYIIITKVLAKFSSVNTSASSALQFHIHLSSKFSLTFDLDLKNNHMLQFIRKAISSHIIVKLKYEDTWNVEIRFDYWRGKGLNRNLTNIELQTKHTSLHMTNCSIRPAEIEQVFLKQSVFIENLIIQAKVCQISFRLKKLLDLMGKKGKHVYSFRHSAATQLVIMGPDETLLNTFTGYTRNSKSTNQNYLFTERSKDKEITTKLSDSRGQVECNSISSTQQR
ncbi:MAG: hypothetical protein EZS28_024654 [Streblomastix strix]|uniref:Tyr recombinase domain-containing protein n=1 Tax=Streblomastix strix TaxID=222440 RepID=A0A5J4VBJ7_9EUKA|nr:MAG: hypothetical protein EZS28_024654 [Streblomastix strix]